MLLGNAIYFLLMPHMPAGARHAPNRLDVGLAVDFWFCLVAYGVIDLAQRLRARQHPREQ